MKVPAAVALASLVLSSTAAANIPRPSPHAPKMRYEKLLAQDPIEEMLAQPLRRDRLQALAASKTLEKAVVGYVINEYAVALLADQEGETYFMRHAPVQDGMAQKDAWLDVVLAADGSEVAIIGIYAGRAGSAPTPAIVGGEFRTALEDLSRSLVGIMETFDRMERTRDPGSQRYLEWILARGSDRIEPLQRGIYRALKEHQFLPGDF